MSEVTIKGDPGVLTMIHVHHTQEDSQKAIYDGLLRGLEVYGRRMAGHLSSAIHKSLDGLRVTSYSQWDAVAARALFDDPAALKQSLDGFAPLTAKAIGQDAHVYGELSICQP